MRRILAVALLVCLGVVIFFRGEERGPRQRIESPDHTEVVEPQAGELAPAPTAATPEPGSRTELTGPADSSAEQASEPVERPDLVGRVLFAASGEPYANKLLAIWDASSYRKLTTNDQGGFSELEIHAGSYGFAIADKLGSALGWKLKRDRFDLSPRADGAPIELELVVELATSTLEVEVVPRPGSEAPCNVTFGSPGFFIRARTWRPGEGDLRFGYRQSELTDGVLLWAASEEGEFSEFVALEADRMPSRVRLDLRAGATVDVRVWTHEGEVAPGRQVLLIPRNGLDAMEGGAPETTDDAGRASFQHLPPCPTDVCLLTADGYFASYERIELLPAEHTSLEITLVPGLPLAVSGVVLDEAGEPLANCMLVVQPEGLPRHWERNVTTGSDGTFALHAPECPAVVVTANLDPSGGVFSPSSLRAEHGADDLVLRRTSVAAERSFQVLAIDTESGEPLDEVVASFDRGPAGRRWSITYAPRKHFTVRVEEDTRLRVAAEGYRSLALSLAEALDELKGDEPLRLEMTPGLHLRLRVFDAASDTPLPEVLFVAPGGGRARSDGAGWVTLEADTWPTYQVEKPGYITQECEPADYVLFDDGELHLEAMEPSED